MTMRGTTKPDMSVSAPNSMTDSRGPRASRLRCGLLGAVALGSDLVLSTLPTPAQAQGTVYIGGSSANVEVNLDVIDAPEGTGARFLLPPPATAPKSRLISGGETDTRQLVLNPPGTSGANAGTSVVRLEPPSGTPSLAGSTAAAAEARRQAPPPRQATARPAPIAPSPSSAPPPPPPKVASAAPAQPERRASAPSEPVRSEPAQTEPTRTESPQPERTSSAPPPPPEPRPSATEERSSPAARPQASEQPTQTAQLQGASAALASGQALRIRFAANESRLPTSAEADLKALAARMEQDSSARLQLLAYASGSAETASRARRTSLARSLAVRSFLIDQGVRSTRIDVRALGTSADGGPADRVDVNVIKR